MYEGLAAGQAGQTSPSFYSQEAPEIRAAVTCPVRPWGGVDTRSDPESSTLPAAGGEQTPVLSASGTQTGRK